MAAASRFGGGWRRVRSRSLGVVAELTSEAEEYRMEDRPDGVFQVVKERDDGLDATRYALTWRPWYATHEESEERPRWEPGKAPPQSWFTGSRESPPMGAMS